MKLERLSTQTRKKILVLFFSTLLNSSPTQAGSQLSKCFDRHKYLSKQSNIYDAITSFVNNNSLDSGQKFCCDSNPSRFAKQNCTLKKSNKCELRFDDIEGQCSKIGHSTFCVATSYKFGPLSQTTRSMPSKICGGIVGDVSQPVEETTTGTCPKLEIVEKTLNETGTSANTSCANGSCLLQLPKASTMEINAGALPTPWPIETINTIISIVSIFTFQMEESSFAKQTLSVIVKPQTYQRLHREIGKEFQKKLIADYKRAGNSKNLQKEENIERENFKIRPVLIMSNDWQNQYDKYSVIAPLTSDKEELKKGVASFEVLIEPNEKNGLDKSSKILLNRLQIIDKNFRLIRKVAANSTDYISVHCQENNFCYLTDKRLLTANFVMRLLSMILPVGLLLLLALMNSTGDEGSLVMGILSVVTSLPIFGYLIFIIGKAIVEAVGKKMEKGEVTLFTVLAFAFDRDTQVVAVFAIIVKTLLYCSISLALISYTAVIATNQAKILNTTGLESCDINQKLLSSKTGYLPE
ncbi:16003_t:CDS:2 [Racocetra fulgida]|uniref:16003_t:CDS:1 n=1 Tax=Racocetra fulgida TaxID=60492 RepID=A0A9N9FMX1_9GLOM|nr:16003_t:CDS:2 [Racocetra fulgida]